MLVHAIAASTTARQMLKGSQILRKCRMEKKAQLVWRCRRSSGYSLLNMYPFPRTVNTILGSTASSQSFSRSRVTCMSMVRVGSPWGEMRQTLASNSSRATTRPALAAK